MHSKPSRRDFLGTVGRSALGLGLVGFGTGVALPSLPSPDDPAYWRIVRDQYPLTHDRTYLNTGGLGPAPFPVLHAVHATEMALQTRSETGHRRIDDVRTAVAAFFGALPSEIAFMRNATEGNATVASGLRLSAGDEVIFDAHAHPGGSFAWLNRQKQDGIRVRLFEPDTESATGNLERIAAQITPRTRVIQVSHITAPTGIHFPVKAIADLARENDCWFHIDGAQSAGMIPVDLHALGCDSYAASGHKWMGTTHGTGFLYIREDRLDEVRPTETGAYGDNGTVRLPDQFDYNETAQRYEVGTRNAAMIVGVGAAVRFLEQIGIERVAARGQRLAQLLQHQLRAIDGVEILTPEDPSLSAAITTFKLSAVPYDRVYRYFVNAHKLRCRIVTERGLDAIRVSTHIFNSEADCLRVADAAAAARTHA